jgi:hypothetical protein
MRLTPLLAGLLLPTSVSLGALAQTTPAKPKPRDTKPAHATAAAAPVEPAPKPPVPPDVPPPPPPPWTSPGAPSTSTSGATLLPEAPAPSAGPKVAPELASVLSAQETAALEGRIRALEARLAADEATRGGASAPEWLSKFKVGGYIQPQLLIQSYNTAASPNVVGGSLPAGVSANGTIAKSNGSTTNGDYFRLRRARLKTEFMPTEGTRLVFEFDPTPAGGTVGGTGTIARQVEAQGIARWSPFVTTEFAAGIFKIPFGFEVLQTDADRPFIERSWGEQNMTPGEFDTGARAYTTWAKDRRSFGLQVAIVNGQTEGEPGFSLDPDLNRSKDLVGRTFFDFGDWVEIGASGYYGEGQNVNAMNLEFKQFVRWAGNGELNLRHTFSESVGATKIFSEVTFAQNMDRGVHYGFAVPAIPTPFTANVVNLKERSVWVRLEQDFSKWVTLGGRWDEYTPDTSLASNARDTFAVVGVIHFTPWLQTMIEYDHAIDHVHPSGAPAPDKVIDSASGVLQARF